MVFLVIGIVLVVAVGAVITRRSRTPVEPQEMQQSDAPAQVENAPVVEAPRTENTEIPDSVVLSHTPTPVPAPPAAGAPLPQPPAPPAAPEPVAPPPLSISEEIVPLKPVLAAEPISSPSALSSATYSSVAPASLSGESPYAFGNSEEPKAKADSTLLRWSGRTGSIQVGELAIRGPVAYWSDGPASTPEPSCIDILLPVEVPGEGGGNLPAEGAPSYREMTPLQRGAYLLWLAGGRIQPPLHVSHPVMWIFGLERRVLADRLDIPLCIGEAFRLLPLIRWESLRQGLIKFITWMAAKMWLPEDQLLAFSRSLPSVPTEILSMLLRPYADSRLPLPAAIAFAVMRGSSLGGEQRNLQHSDDLMARFSTLYRTKCPGGLVLPRPKNSVFVAYVPTNPSLAGEKNAAGGVLELPDFFKDPGDFAPLIAVWNEFLKSLAPDSPAVPDAPAETEERPDWDSFVREIQGDEGETEEAENAPPTGPALTSLGALADLMRIERRKTESGDYKKPGAADRKKIAEAAHVEGFLVVPNLGIAGKEYHWEDPVALTPLEMGARPSPDHNAAALMLEFSCALTGSSPTEEVARLNDWFSLSSDDRERLLALTEVLSARPPDPENIGECLQFWLSREQRAVVRDFLDGFLVQPAPEAVRADLSRTVCTTLDVATTDPPPGPRETPLALGEQVVKVLGALFKE